MNGIADGIATLWHGLIDLLAKIVTPDWGGLIALIPLALLPLVLLYAGLAFLGWVLYAVAKPRARVAIVEGPRALPRDAAGDYLLPTAEPFSLREGLVYPPGTVRAANGDPLTVRCPVCRVDREAELTACGNCGLVLNFRTGMRSARPAGPPPGGAAIA